MLEMTLLEHLQELRVRLIRILIGTATAYAFAVCFAAELWRVVSAPAAAALRQLGVAEKLYILSPMDGFLTIHVKLPLLAALFLASPWILWQVWAFIAPGLYPRERRLAGPFVVCTAGLFVTGGSRYAILGIVVLAAVVSPTTDPVNLAIFSVPMILLYFVGVAAGWLFVMRRDGLPFPWRKFVLYAVLPVAAAAGTAVAFFVFRSGIHLVARWPFLVK